MNPQSTAMLGLLAETSIHAGSGQTLGSVDLPIQREGHTQWPCVFGSGVKGALRARADEMNVPDLEVIFGPDVKKQKASEHAGALAVGDARLLLLPIRSLTGPFRWVTCPAVLARWCRDLRRLAVDGVDLARLEQELASLTGAVKDDVVVLASEPHEHAGTPFFLEELRFTVEVRSLKVLVETLARLLRPLERSKPTAGEAGRGEARSLEESTVHRLLTVVDDTVFGDLARFGVPVSPHITIDNETKTVTSAALWTEESLPPETVLYVPLHASRSRRVGDPLESDEVLARLLDGLAPRPYLQLGGNETVGMGWCRLAVLDGAAPEDAALQDSRNGGAS